MHAAYDTSNTDHDIALIEMDRPVDFSHGVRPVCLPDEDAEFVGELQFDTFTYLLRYCTG